MTVEVFKSKCRTFRKGDCVIVDCLNAHALFAPKAKPLRIRNQIKDEFRLIIWGVYTENQVLKPWVEPSVKPTDGL